MSPILGIELSDVADGEARAAMSVDESMLNIMGVCHGGVIFTLADTAMERACNTDGSRSVAAHAEIDFLRPAPLGAQLVASAHVTEAWGRSKLLDVRVVDQNDGETIARFRGRTRATNRS